MLPDFLKLIPNTDHSNHLLRTRWNVPLAHFVYGYLKLKKSPLVNRFTPARTEQHMLIEDESGTYLTFSVAFKDMLSQNSTSNLTAQCEMTFDAEKVDIKLSNLAEPLAEYKG